MQFGGLTAVDTVDCTVEQGKIQSIIGPNGAGKTTVFNAITGIYDPTSGSITFEGQELGRPLTKRVLIGCGLIGLLTAMFFGISTIGIDKLWLAAIKRNYSSRDKDFSYSTALRSAVAYWRGDLAVQKSYGNRWAVVSANGEHTLQSLATREEAEVRRSELQAEMAAGNDARLNEVAKDAAWRRRITCLALFAGMFTGSAGAFAVWNRARRAPTLSPGPVLPARFRTFVYSRT